MLEEIPDVTYDNIGGLDDQLELVRDAVELPFLHPDLFSEHKLLPPKGVLLYGKSWAEVTKKIGIDIASAVIDKIIQTGVEMVANFVIGETLGAAALAISIAAGATVASAWAAAAALVSLASFGAPIERFSPVVRFSNSTSAFAGIVVFHASVAAVSSTFNKCKLIISGSSDFVVKVKSRLFPVIPTLSTDST